MNRAETQPVVSELIKRVLPSPPFTISDTFQYKLPTVTPSAPEQLLLELFVIFVTAKVLGEPFERMNLPGVPGEILAGMLLGPFILGWIPASDTLRSVAQVGAIFILFSAGLETSPQDLIRVSRKALVVSVLGVVAPFVLGFLY